MSTPEKEVTEIATRSADSAVGFSTAAGFELLQRQAKMMSQSGLVPKQYQGNIPNCAIALELAARIGMSPIMVAQNLDVINDRPSWRSQFIIAAINSSGRFSTLQFEFKGEGDDRSCTAYATNLATGEIVHGPPVSIKMAKKEGWWDRKGSKWPTLTDLMMCYRAAAFFGRLYCPGPLMGMLSTEELQDMGVTQPSPAARFVQAGQTIIPAEIVDPESPQEPAVEVYEPTCPHPGPIDIEVPSDIPDEPPALAEVCSQCGKPWSEVGKEQAT